MSGPTDRARRREEEVSPLSVSRSMLVQPEPKSLPVMIFSPDRSVDELITEPSPVTDEVTRSAIPIPLMRVPPVIRPAIAQRRRMVLQRSYPAGLVIGYPDGSCQSGDTVCPGVKARPDSISLKGGEPDLITGEGNDIEFPVCIMSPDGAGELVL